jgi:hypothetical protein
MELNTGLFAGCVVSGLSEKQTVWVRFRLCQSQEQKEK